MALSLLRFMVDDVECWCLGNVSYVSDVIKCEEGWLGAVVKMFWGARIRSVRSECSDDEL
jgi:hypothetical protein